MKLADDQDRHTILDGFKFMPDLTFYFRDFCPSGPKMSMSGT